MNVNWKTMLVAGLTVCLAVSLFFNGYLYYKLTRSLEHYSPTFFSFVFGPTMQNITSGNLYLNLTFDIVEGNLTVKAEVNAESYNPNAFLALQFDSDNNGTIDIRYWPQDDFYTYQYWRDDLQFLLEANNLTLPSLSEYWGWLPNGTIYLDRSPPFSGWAEEESPFHYCVHTNGIYTFYFTYAINNPDKPHYAIQGKLVRVLFGIVSTEGVSWPSPAEGMAVYVPPFNFME